MKERILMCLHVIDVSGKPATMTLCHFLQPFVLTVMAVCR